MDCRYGDVWVYSLGERVLKEFQVGSPEYASVVWVDLNVHDLLMMEACYGDCGG